MLGPLVMLASFLIFFLKISALFAWIPVMACAALFLCWRFKLVGLAFSVGMIAALLFYYYPQMSADERLWQVGIAMAFALSCLVTALCSEETEGLLKALQVESESRLEHLRRMDEKLKMTKKAARYEYEELKGQLTKAYNQLAEKEGKVEAQEEVIEILRDELKNLRKPAVDPRVLEQVETLTREKELLQTTLSKLQKELISKV